MRRSAESRPRTGPPSRSSPTCSLSGGRAADNGGFRRLVRTPICRHLRRPHRRRSRVLFLLAILAIPAAAQDQPKPARTILAIGAHAGDMELTCGALLLKESLRGDRVVILHLTLGERGNPALTADAYAEQKRREATAADAALGAEVMFGPYHDGEVPDSDDARRYVAGIIRQVKPTLVITHWRRSLHKDHSRTSAIVVDAVLLASLDGVHVRSVWYVENWEDAEGFSPYIYVDVSGSIPRWREAVTW